MKDKVFSIRLSEKDAMKFEKTGRKPKEAMLFFLKEYYTGSKKGLKIAKSDLELKINELELELLKAKQELKNIENILDNQDVYDLDYYDNEVKEAVNTVIKAYKRKDIDDIKKLDETVFFTNAERCNIPVEDFKKIVFDNFEKLREV